MLPETAKKSRSNGADRLTREFFGGVLASLCVRMKHSAILATFAALLLAGCGKNSTGTYQGYIEGEYVYVASPLGGALTNLAVARGDSVKTGPLRFDLERQSEADVVVQAEKNLAEAQAQLAALKKGRRPTEIASLAAQIERATAA